jgi:hypothetical protein
MKKQEIGENAGIIWQIIYNETEMPLKKMKKQSGIISDMDFYMAIGWLSRENKIHFFERNNELFIGLVV